MRLNFFQQELAQNSSDNNDQQNLNQVINCRYKNQLDHVSGYKEIERKNYAVNKNTPDFMIFLVGYFFFLFGKLPERSQQVVGRIDDKKQGNEIYNKSQDQEKFCKHRKYYKDIRAYIILF